MLAAKVGLAGASKLGLLSKSPIGKSGIYDTAAKARKAGMTATAKAGSMKGAAAETVKNLCQQIEM